MTDSPRPREHPAAGTVEARMKNNGEGSGALSSGDNLVVQSQTRSSCDPLRRVGEQIEKIKEWNEGKREKSGRRRERVGAED